MCGITGIYAHNLVGRMNMINLAMATEKLSHRGPDFQNGYNDNMVGLGHRRLSVIDTSPDGHQPMCDHSERYWIVFNGEIYNYLEMKEELHEKGVSFRSRTDTEVALQMLIAHGEKALDRFNGFFSLAFYDKWEKKLLIALDRFGIKPLYYYSDADKFLFSSELYSLIQFGIQKEIDPAALQFYLQLNYIPGPLTMLRGVNKLLPGHLARIDENGTSVEKWYDPGIADTSALSYEDAGRRVKELLERSVTERLVADVPLGSFLSGGLDSSVIAMLAARHKEDLHTFSVTFSEEPYFDESRYSRLVSKHIGSQHHEYDLTQKKFEEHAEAIMDSFGEPFADSSAIAYYLLSRETRNASTVALSGDGADELFGGYNKHRAFTKLRSNPVWNLSAMALLPLTSLVPGSRSSRAGNFMRRAGRYGKAASLRGTDRYWFLATLASDKQVSRWLNSAWYEAVDKTDMQNLRDQLMGPAAGGRDLNSLLASDRHLVLPWDMLVKADRMSMANGLEVRVPFLDHRLVEFVASLPAHYKIDGNRQKRILYDAFRGDLPPELYDRPKRGFEVPLLKWLRSSSLRYELGKLTDPAFLSDQGIFEPKKVKKLIRSIEKGNPHDSHAHAWAIFVFQWWYRRFFG